MKWWLFTTPGHFRTGDIATFIDKIKIALFALYTSISHFFSIPAALTGTSHFGTPDIAIFAEVVKIT